MIGQSQPRLGGRQMQRRHNAKLDECALVFDLLEAAGKPGLMVDVGAHFGGSLGRFARAGWKVLAFEPDAENRAKLEQRLAAAPQEYAGVWISPMAVSDEVREDVAFFSSPVSTGISGLSAFHESHAETARVSTTTLNDIVREHGLQAIDFLKIDVEGHEMSVLSGLDFSRVRPAAVVAEFEDSKTLPNGYSTRELANFLMDRGYSVFASEWHPVERYGGNHQWRRFVRWPARIPPNAWGNLVAFVHPPGADQINAALRRRVTWTRSGFEMQMDRLRQFISRI